MKKFLKLFLVQGDGQRRDASPPSLAFHFQTFSRKLPPGATANTAWNVNYWAWISAVGYTITLETPPNRPKTGIFWRCEAAVVPVMPVWALSRTLQGPTAKERLPHLHFTFPLQVNNIIPTGDRQITQPGQMLRCGWSKASNTVRNGGKIRKSGESDLWVARGRLGGGEWRRAAAWTPPPPPQPPPSGNTAATTTCNTATTNMAPPQCMTPHLPPRPPCFPRHASLPG